MKNLGLVSSLLLIIIIGSQSISNAQIIYEKDKFDNYYLPSSTVNSNYNVYTKGTSELNYKSSLDYNVENNIKAKDYTKYKIKRKGTRQIEKSRLIERYNNEGRILDRFIMVRGKEKKHFLFDYNSNGMFTNYKKYARGKFKTHELLVYDNNNNVLVYNRYNGDKFKARSLASYKDSLIVFQTEYDKDTTEIRRKWEYDYYQTLDKKETRYFLKGKLKHKWSYTCDDEGKEVKPKDETTVCELKQYNADSTYVLIKRFTGKKGKITKHRVTYNKNDKVILREYINVKDKITDKRGYAYNSAGKESGSYYYKRGKKSDQIRWAREVKFNENNKVTETKYFGKNKKYRSIISYTYNDKDLIATTISKKSDGTLKFRNQFFYNDKDLQAKVLKYNKKDKLVKMYVSSYQYF